MSTDLGMPQRATPPKGFWRLAWILVAVLAVVAAGLGAAGLVRGPDLVGGTFAADQAVAAAGQRLVLESRLPLAEVTAEQVQVSPAVPFTVATRGNTLTVRFTAPLAYGVGYRVDVAGARSAHTGTTSSWSYRFSTPTVELFTLVAHRDGTATDTIVTEASGQAEVRLQGPTIDAFVAARDALVAIAHPTADTSTLLAARRADGAPLRVTAPDVGLLTELHAAPDGSKVGFVATGTDPGNQRRYEGALFIADAANLAGAPAEVLAAGQPLAVQEWDFVPGVNAVVVVTPQQQGFLIYLDGATPPVPLGSIAQLIGFLPGSQTLLAEVSGKQLVLDLAGGRTREAPVTSDPSGDTFAGRRHFRALDDLLIEYNRFERNSGTTRNTTWLAHVTPSGRKDLLTMEPGQGQLLNSGLSPNGQFAWAVVLSPDAPLSDLSSGASANAVTVVFDLATGAEVARLPGSTPVWAV